MTQEELKRIGDIQLELLEEVHRLCVGHKIRYYMIGGTLLGAVRHRGFIPWDLDIDIAMPREDYERFKILCRTELDQQYRYMDHESCRNYMRPHALIVHNGTRLQIKYDQVNPVQMELGVYLDVFPLDQAPDAENLRERQAAALKRVSRLKERRLFYSYSSKRWRRYLHYAVAALLVWLPVPVINAYQQKLMQRYRNQDTACLCSMASRYRYSKQCMPREVYGTPVLLEFEGRQFYAPEQYLTYLTRLYGDYMRLPPEEQRQANLECYASFQYL